MNMPKTGYEAPILTKLGAFESLTQGQGSGFKFDSNFTVGAPVPVDGSGHPLIFS